MHAVITSSKLQTLKANGSSMHKSKRPMVQLRTKHKNATSGIMLTFFMYLPPFVLLVLVSRKHSIPNMKRRTACEVTSFGSPNAGVIYLISR